MTDVYALAVLEIHCPHDAGDIIQSVSKYVDVCFRVTAITVDLLCIFKQANSLKTLLGSFSTSVYHIPIRGR